MKNAVYVITMTVGVKMTVNDLIKNNEFIALALPDGEREIDGVYAGDLLSWVMGRAKADNIWITIMSNVNILAVASLADTSCIVLAEGVTVSKEVIDTAVEKNINILSTNMDIYTASVYLSNII